MRRRAVERALAARFTGAHPEVPVARIPARPEDVHDLDELRSVGEDLSAG
jgi:hypothetical protein